MSHHSHLLGRTSTPRRPQPFDRFTKAQLWERLQVAEGRIESAAGKANALGRDLRREALRMPAVSSIRYRVLDLSGRAYGTRDILRGNGSE